MKKRMAFAAALLSFAATSTLAQDMAVRGVAGLGITFGGDTLADIPYGRNPDGSAEGSVKVHAGGLVAFNVGAEIQFTDFVSMQALIGYHVDRASFSNGNARFERFPLELLGHFRVNDAFRLGGGLRYTSNPKLRVSGAPEDYAADQTYKPVTGAVVEGEYFFSRNLGLKLRYVSEKFRSKADPTAAEVDGNHGGVYVNYYF